MARKRDLKPSFFDNEILADLHPLTRLLFQGLWCHADRRGIIEDRPARIKVKVLPFDDHDVDAALDDLADGGFITRYEVDGARCILVNAFDKHQRPHKNEPESDLPANPHGYADSVQSHPMAEALGTNQSSCARGPAKVVSSEGLVVRTSTSSQRDTQTTSFARDLDGALAELREVWPPERSFPSDHNRQVEAIFDVAEVMPDNLAELAAKYLEAHGWGPGHVHGCPNLSKWLADRRWLAPLPAPKQSGRAAQQQDYVVTRLKQAGLA